MKKRIISMITVMTVVFMMTTTAFAGQVEYAATQNGSNGNAWNYQVQQSVVTNVCVEKANCTQNKSDTYTEIKIKAIAESANAQVSLEVKKAQAKAKYINNQKVVDIIIKNLVDKTTKITKKAIDKIDRLGGEAVCEWTAVEVGGQIVMIDPIRIIRIR